MLLTEYLSGLTDSISGYAKTGLILSSEITIDSRTDKIGLIKGKVFFINESKLFFTEYLDLRYTRKSYHTSSIIRTDPAHWYSGMTMLHIGLPFRLLITSMLTWV